MTDTAHREAEQHLARAWALLPATEADLRPFNALLDDEILQGRDRGARASHPSHQAERAFWLALSLAARELDWREATVRLRSRAATPH